MHGKFKVLIDCYQEKTSKRYDNPNAAMNHIVDIYGPPCENCEKPYRTSKAAFCDACGHKRNYLSMKIFDLIVKLMSSNKSPKGDVRPSSFENEVERDILSNNKFGISEVKGLRSIKSMYFEREKYPAIASLIQGQNLAELAEIKGNTLNPEFPEYLEIMHFESQLGQMFIVTVYDSIELWQDPEVIDIFPVS